MSKLWLLVVAACAHTVPQDLHTGADGTIHVDLRSQAVMKARVRLEPPPPVLPPLPTPPAQPRPSR